MAAITQIRDPGTQGRISFERKLAEDKTKKGAIRFLKRRISYAVYSQLLLDAPIGDPGEQPGTTQCLRDRLFTLRDRLFGEVPRGPIKGGAPYESMGIVPGAKEMPFGNRHFRSLDSGSDSDPLLPLLER